MSLNMKQNEIGWTELLILLLVIVLGVAAFSFYYAGMAIGYKRIPILIMQMVVIITQLVILSVVYKMYILVKEKLKK